MTTNNEEMDDLTVRHYGERRMDRRFRYVSYDEERREIIIKTARGSTYDVPLSRCTTAGECLDWIHQLHVKTWFDETREKEFIDMLLRLIPTDLWSGAGFGQDNESKTKETARDLSKRLEKAYEEIARLQGALEDIVIWAEGSTCEICGVKKMTDTDAYDYARKALKETP